MVLSPFTYGCVLFWFLLDQTEAQGYGQGYYGEQTKAPTIELLRCSTDIPELCSLCYLPTVQNSCRQFCTQSCWKPKSGSGNGGIISKTHSDSPYSRPRPTLQIQPPIVDELPASPFTPLPQQLTTTPLNDGNAGAADGEFDQNRPDDEAPNDGPQHKMDVISLWHRRLWPTLIDGKFHGDGR